MLRCSQFLTFVVDLIKEITDKHENAIKYQQKADVNLCETILHRDIQEIEEQ